VVGDNYMLQSENGSSTLKLNFREGNLINISVVGRLLPFCSILPFAVAELGRTWQLAEGLGQNLAEVQKVLEDA
jgi:hypothetical protein